MGREVSRCSLSNTVGFDPVISQSPVPGSKYRRIHRWGEDPMANISSSWRRRLWGQGRSSGHVSRVSVLYCAKRVKNPANVSVTNLPNSCEDHSSGAIESIRPGQSTSPESSRYTRLSACDNFGPSSNEVRWENVRESVTRNSPLKSPSDLSESAIPQRDDVLVPGCGQ